MKKQLLLLFGVLIAMLASADNYFTVGENDTLRINPMYLNSTVIVPVHAHLDGRIDYWYASLLSHEPYGLKITASSRGPGMDVPYRDSSGQDTVCHASLTYLRTDTTVNVFISRIQEIGYWDANVDGIYEPYGTVKWESGDYDCMFNVSFRIEPYFRQDTLSFDIHITSTGDLRGGIIPSYRSITRVFVYVGLMPGDVDKNETVSMGDLSELINYLLGSSDFDEFQMEAGDLNGDGLVNMDDLSILTNRLLSPDLVQEE